MSSDGDEQPGSSTSKPIEDQLVEAQKFSTEARAAANEAIERRNDAQAAADASAAAKARAESEVALIETARNSIEELQTKISGIHADLVKALATAQAQQTQAETSAQAATNASAGSQSTKVEIDALRDAAKLAFDEIEKSKSDSASATGISKSLAGKAATIEKRVQEYEEKLKTLSDECDRQLTEITRLLPGATSAGLASAFDERRKHFVNPGAWWQGIFVGSLIGLTVLAVWSLFSGTAATYDDLVRHWLARLPIAGALIWLALHSSREAALAKRLEEDYAYKAAIASSFQGFYQQMSEIKQESKPAVQLSLDTLSTIAAPPGRIYDKHRLTATPTQEVRDALLGAATNAAAEAKKS